MLRFHQAAVDLLVDRPAISRENVEILDARERQLNRQFPASVREWYSLERSVELLREFSNCDLPVPLDQLGLPVKKWRQAGHRDFGQEGLLWIMEENQSVCNWAVALDSTDDPPVLVEVDSATNEKWQPLARSFSDFIYCQIWDHPVGYVQCSAQETGLADADLAYLHAHFTPGPRTAYWPGNANIRFNSTVGRVLIWWAENHGVDWFLFAQDQEHMVRLISRLWNCGNLCETLYAVDEVAQDALTDVRRKSH